MGQIEQLVKSKLLGNDNPNNLVWPITKTQAVYDKTNTDLQTVLDSLGSEIQEIKEINNVSVRYDQVQELTEEQKETARTNIDAGTYSKPEGGIPTTDLASGVRSSLAKADSALQGIMLNWDKNNGISISDIRSAVISSKQNLPVFIYGTGLKHLFWNQSEEDPLDDSDIRSFLVTSIVDNDFSFDISAIGCKSESNHPIGISLRVDVEENPGEVIEAIICDPTSQIPVITEATNAEIDALFDGGSSEDESEDESDAEGALFTLMSFPTSQQIASQSGSQVSGDLTATGTTDYITPQNNTYDLLDSNNNPIGGVWLESIPAFGELIFAGEWGGSIHVILDLDSMTWGGVIS